MNSNFKKAYGLLVGCLIACITPAQAQLVKGTIVGNERIESVNLYLMSSTEIPKATKVIVGENGQFSWSQELKEGSAEAVLLVNGLQCGLYLEANKTVELAIKKGSDGTLYAELTGDNADISRFYTRYLNKLYYYQLKEMDDLYEKPQANIVEMLKRDLNLAYEQVLQQAVNIQNPSKRAYYSQLALDRSCYILLKFYTRKAIVERKPLSSYPEFIEKASQINPNSKTAIKSSLIDFFVEGKMEEFMLNHSWNNATSYGLESLKIIGRYVSDSVARLSIAKHNASQFFTYAGGNDDVISYWKQLLVLTNNNKELIARYQERASASARVAKGNKATDIILTDINGKQHCLSDYWNQVLYIDIWATWCAPCRKEIPALQKLEEHYKENKKVKFISISVDANAKQWKDMVVKEKLQGQQFNLNSKESGVFMNSWGISSIPRFIILKKDGIIYDADALRPSDSSIIGTIDGLVSE